MNPETPSPRSLEVGERSLTHDGAILTCSGPGGVELWRIEETRSPTGVVDGLTTFSSGPARRIVDGRPSDQPTRWFLYVLRSQSRARTYVGIAKDPLARLAQHNGLRPGGARSTRSGRPWALGRVFGPYDDRSAASKAEHQLKRRRGPARLLDPAP